MSDFFYPFAFALVAAETVGGLFALIVLVTRDAVRP